MNHEGNAAPCCAPSTEDLRTEDEVTQAVEVFKALGDATRLRIVAHIATSPTGMACACHLPDALGISQPTLSHHLKKLVSAGVLTREQRGRWAHFRLASALEELVVARLREVLPA